MKNKVKYTVEELLADAKKYKTRGAWRKNSSSMYTYARNNKILDLICAHMVRASGELMKRKYSDEDLLDIALDYQSVSEFVEKKRSAYFTLQSRGLLDKACAHMTKAINPKSYKELEYIASLFETRVSFLNAYPNEYRCASKRGILESICQHMGRNEGSSYYEQCLMEEIKKIHAEAKKKRVTKIRIEGKPHIKGFDIDIFVPSLNKGIEFDGKFYHSYAGLKMSRNHWPDEDIINYHEIKDTFFKSINIEVLHIKEEDWIKDKSVCVKTCLDFLSKGL